MEAKHTPGPWIAEPEEASEHRGIAICAADAILATILPEDDREADAEDWANARLIAAAPDLLAALEAVWGGRYNAGENGCMVHLTLKMCETIPAIIAKARGEA